MIDPRRSLSMKLSLSLLLLAIPIFVLSLGVLFVQSRKNVKEEATKHAFSVLNTTTQRFSRYVNAVETATNVNSWFITKFLHPDSLLAISRRVVSLNPHIDGCSISTEPYVFPQFGRYFSAYTVREPDSIATVIEEEYEYFEKVWYKKPHDLNQSCWVVYYDESDSLTVTLDGMVASYSKPVYDDQNRFLAVISTDLSLLHLSKLFNTEKPFPNSYFMMIGEEGRFLLHPDTTQLFTRTIFSDADPRRQADLFALGHEMTAGNEGNMPVVVNGVPCLVCYQPVPGTPWSLAIVCPESDVLQGYHRLTYLVAVLISLGLLVILFLSYRAVNHSIRPLNQLLIKSQAIASGNTEEYIPRSPREDAVGELQNSFATMLQSLNFHIGSVQYTTDQAERRNEELAKATRLVEEADKQKRAFIQSVSHQIRTPLNITMGFAQVLREAAGSAGTVKSLLEIMPEEELKSITGMMNYNANLLSRMVLMLFDSSDMGLAEELNSHKFDIVPCNDVAQEAIGYVKPYYPDVPIGFDTEVDDNFCIHTNRLYLMRSLREIVYNAAKYSDGQHVKLKVMVVKETPAVQFVIEDTGKGIAEADRDKMFEFFTKLDDLSEGLGLGLPLAKRHFNHLGGDLILDADYHDGCRFIARIPLMQ